MSSNSAELTTAGLFCVRGIKGVLKYRLSWQLSSQAQSITQTQQAPAGRLYWGKMEFGVWKRPVFIISTVMITQSRFFPAMFHLLLPSLFRAYLCVMEEEMTSIDPAWSYKCRDVPLSSKSPEWSGILSGPFTVMPPTYSTRLSPPCYLCFIMLFLFSPIFLSFSLSN